MAEKQLDTKVYSKNNIGYKLEMLLFTGSRIIPDSLPNIQAPTLVTAGQYHVAKRNHTKLIAEKIPKK